MNFAEWDSFYLIVGGAAGALIGLQFVVLTLLAAREHRTESIAGHAFATPTVLHFCVALLIAALLRAPWHSVTAPSIVWGAIGALGVIYSGIVMKRMTTQHTYKPEFVDWLTYLILPVAGYAGLLVAAFTRASYIRNSLFGVGASILLLLFVGIYNAWDTVTFNIFKSAPPTEDIGEDDGN